MADSKNLKRLNDAINKLLGTAYSKYKESIKTLKEIDSLLTEIGISSHMTSSELKKLGDTSFETASRYGKQASEYLSAVREMSHSGNKNAEEMAELSLLAQTSGDLSAEAARDYLTAADAAYNLQGNITKLNAILDSQNTLSVKAAVSMADMAQATTGAAAVAAKYGIEIDELSSLIAVILSKTNASGTEAAEALNSILTDLQDTSSQSVTDIFDSLHISMTEFVSDSEKLKTPAALLEELSAAYAGLPEDSSLKTDILNQIGSSSPALSAVLNNWNTYSQMLAQYSESSGTAMKEAARSADSFEGSLNRLSNTWTSIISNIADTSLLTGTVNLLDTLLSKAEGLTSLIGPLSSIGAVIGAIQSKNNAGKPFVLLT